MAVRTIDVRERVMARNDALAAQVRHRLQAARVPALNLVSSPGAGKTLLLERSYIANLLAAFEKEAGEVT